MEIKDILNNESIIGVVSNYKHNLNLNAKVSDLEIKNVSNALKMVLLDDSYLVKKLNELSISELWKIDLATKLNNEIIIVGNLYNSLIYKDRDYMKKLLVKLSNDYGKKIVIIDNTINSFINCVKKILVIKNKNVVYETSNFYDDELYKYVRMPKIIEFVKHVNKNNKIIDENVDIYELIKDIYRRVS